MTHPFSNQIDAAVNWDNWVNFVNWELSLATVSTFDTEVFFIKFRLVLV